MDFTLVAMNSITKLNSDAVQDISILKFNGNCRYNCCTKTPITAEMDTCLIMRIYGFIIIIIFKVSLQNALPLIVNGIIYNLTPLHAALHYHFINEVSAISLYQHTPMIKTFINFNILTVNFFVALEPVHISNYFSFVSVLSRFIEIRASIR